MQFSRQAIGEHRVVPDDSSPLTPDNCTWLQPKKGTDMRRTIAALAVVATMCLLGITAADACGDKSLRIGRGPRFQRKMEPATILIYVPRTASQGAVSRPSCLEPIAPALEKFLDDRGLKSRRVRGGDLVEALNSGEQCDVVLVDLSETEGLQAQLDTSIAKPVLVAVASKQMSAQVKASKNRYVSIVKDVTNADQYLDAIEVAMKSKMRSIAGKR